ncbi:MAG TPA: hypothetical protein VFI47_18210, partial [Acidimicrobiales bacterium]|nr:hypothetical protein [Acidimicrobiales bacterium]
GTETTARPTTTATATTDSTAAPGTTAPPETPTTAGGDLPGDVPGEVPGVAARTGGSSGEVAVEWNPADGATGYRVLRAGAPAGPFEVAADFDVTTGSVTAADGVVNIWSAQHSYVPDRGEPLAGPDTSPWFEYVDVGTGERCYQVLAHNAAGAGPASGVVCGSPP